jgi:hypothetical protein
MGDMKPMLSSDTRFRPPPYTGMGCEVGLQQAIPSWRLVNYEFETHLVSPRKLGYAPAFDWARTSLQPGFGGRCRPNRRSAPRAIDP